MSETLHFPARLSRVWRISRVHEPLLIHSLQNQNSTLLIITQYYQNKIYHYGNVMMGIFYVGVVAGFIVRGDTPHVCFQACEPTLCPSVRNDASQGKWQALSESPAV